MTARVCDNVVDCLYMGTNGEQLHQVLAEGSHRDQRVTIRLVDVFPPVVRPGGETKERYVQKQSR